MAITLTGFTSIAAAERPVVSGSLASDEVLVALFNDVARPPVVLSNFADDPAYSNITREAKKFPQRWHNSAEALLALNPRLVILASYNNPALKARLAQTKITVVELQHFNSIDDIKANIRTIGTAVGRSLQAEALIKDMDLRLQRIASKPTNNPPKILLYSASGNPGGKETLPDAVISAAGGMNLAAVAGTTGWAKISSEILAGLQPDYILTTDGAQTRADMLKTIKQDPLWKNMRAVKEGRIIFVEQSALFAVSHYIVTAVEALGRALP